MGDAIKGFAFGIGATAGVVLGLYASFKGIEAIGYYSAKREQHKENTFVARGENKARLAQVG